MSEATLSVRGIDASCYMTKDLDVSTKFYNELLGLEPTMTAPGTYVEWTFPDGGTFGLYKAEQYSQSGTVMFRVDDVPGFVAAAKAKGISFAGDGHVDESPICHMAFGTDPDGNYFMVHKSK